ncbi:MAG: type II toxin-antitoxin system RelE/ParE family toxin [Bacteriovoracaceae bacterium]
MWKVDESPEIVFQLAKAPESIQEKYVLWKHMIKTTGPFLPGKGWNTEKLSGPLKHFYSARLNKKWRVVFEIEGKVKIVAVLSITPHLYEKIKR